MLFIVYNIFRFVYINFPKKYCFWTYNCKVRFYLDVKKRSLENLFRVLAICFKVNKMIQSSFAITLTILLITFRYSVFMLSIMNLHGYIIIAAFQQSFVSLLIVIDIGIRASKPLHYGSNIISLILMTGLIILTAA